VATAERLAHTVKGVAGNLGAVKIQAAAAELEKAIHDCGGPERIERSRLALAAALAPVTERLRNAAVVAPVSAPSSPVDPAAQKEALREMLKYLDESDAAAADCLESRRDLLRSFFSPGEFHDFEKSVETFEFGKARELLVRAAGKKGL